MSAAELAMQHSIVETSGSHALQEEKGAVVDGLKVPPQRHVACVQAAYLDGNISRGADLCMYWITLRSFNHPKIPKINLMAVGLSSALTHLT
jgi:hypothetical protein